MDQVIFKKVNKVYHPNTDHEVKALNNVSFTLKQGEFVVILGASGAGKSTLLNVLGGMDNITSGTITIANHEINKLSEKELSVYRRNQVGFVFQFYNLIPNLTALENVQIAATLSKNALDSEETLSKVGLSHRLKNFPSELSGGEQQRVAIARAIVKNPDILLCDEPTGALDSKTGEMIIALLHKIAKDYKKTVIVVTHNEKIANHANRLIRIGDGKIISNKEL